MSIGGMWTGIKWLYAGLLLELIGMTFEASYFQAVIFTVSIGMLLFGIAILGGVMLGEKINGSLQRFRFEFHAY